MTIKPIKNSRKTTENVSEKYMGNVVIDDSGRLANKVLAYVYTGLHK
jgi:hypothetical protein